MEFNSPPTLGFISDQTNTEGDTVSLLIDASDSGGGKRDRFAY